MKLYSQNAEEGQKDQRTSQRRKLQQKQKHKVDYISLLGGIRRGVAEKRVKRQIKQQILERMTMEQLDDLYTKYVPKKPEESDPKRLIEPGSLADLSYRLIESQSNPRKAKIEELSKELKIDFIIRQIVPQYKLDIIDIMDEYAEKMKEVNEIR